MANTVLAKMAVIISANTADMVKGINQANTQLKGFSNGLMDLAKQIGLVFGIQQVASFTIEVSKLAGEYEAVKIAFDRLKDSRQLMEDLKTATNGTVSELALMKRAVQASNFDISLKALPKLLEFATLRAQQTGQSVDYLVDSIVTGIGRKSKLILDNLGISAVQLTEALGGASAASSSIGDVADAVGRIAEANLKNMAGFADNAKTSFDQLTASWENFKVSLGESINQGGGNAIFKDTASIMDVLSSKTLGWTQKVEILLTTWSNEGITEKLKAWDSLIQPILDKQDKLNKFDAQLLINKYGGIEAAIKGLNEMTQLSVALDQTGTRQLENKTAILNILFQRFKEFNESLLKGAEDQNTTIGTLEESIKNLNEEYKDIDITKITELSRNRELVDSYQKQIDKIKELTEVRFKSRANLSFQFNSQSGSNLSKANIPQPDSLPSQVGSPFTVYSQEQQDRLQKEFDMMQQDIARAEQIAQSMKNLTAGIISDLAAAFGASMTGTVDFGQAFLKGIGQFAVQFGETLIAAGVASLAIEQLATNPYTAIIAGAALVAIGSAVTASLSKGVSSLRGGGSGGGFNNRQSVETNSQSYLEFRIRGKDLVAVLSTAEADNQIRGGG